MPIILGVVEDFALERLGTVHKEAWAIVGGTMGLWESIDLLLIVCNGLKVDLERAI